MERKRGTLSLIWAPGIGNAVGSSNPDTRPHRRTRKEVSQEKWQCAVGGFCRLIECLLNPRGTPRKVLSRRFADYGEDWVPMLGSEHISTEKIRTENIRHSPARSPLC